MGDIYIYIFSKRDLWSFPGWPQGMEKFGDRVSPIWRISCTYLEATTISWNHFDYFQTTQKQLAGLLHLIQGDCSLNTKPELQKDTLTTWNNVKIIHWN